MDRGAARGQAVDQRVGERRARMAAVAADGEGADLRVVGGDRPPERAGEIRVELAPGEAADVVGAEDVPGERRHYRCPLWPKPPAPRRLGGNSSTTWNSTCRTGTTTSCAMRAPTSTVKSAAPRFQHDTISSPW